MYRQYTLIALLALASVATVAPGCASFRATPVCLAGAKLAPNGSCRAQQAPIHHVPFRKGYTTRVMQGYHGYVSHKEDLAYSVDFRCSLGTPITASKSGRVWAVREDSDKGCDDPSCVDDANYVIVDHGDGTYSEYYHLQKYGVIVEEGDQVCRGQVIALCGNTGYSSGPHLHYALTDTTRHTVPVRFHEAGQFGFITPETSYTSENALSSTCRPPPYSQLPPEAFAHQGILVDQHLPLVVHPHTRRRRVEVSGTYYGDHPNVAIHRKPIDGGDWDAKCVPVDDDGDFEASFDWSDTKQFPSGTYWFMITGSDEACLSPGWAWSYKVHVR